MHVPLRSIRVLSVDDEPAVGSILARLLSQKGYEVRTADSGSAAMLLIEEWEPDIVISDVIMPGMSGTEFLRWLRVHYPHVGRIALSGLNDPKALEELVADCTFISKPAGTTELLDAITAILSARTASRSLHSNAINRADSTETGGLERLTEHAHAGLVMSGFQHDILNLLSVIRSQSEVLAIDLGPTSDGSGPHLEACRELAGEIGAATQRLETLILSISSDLRRKSCDEDLRDVLRWTLRALRTLPVEVDLSVPSVPVMIRAAGGELGRVVLNLIRNAADAASSRIMVQLTTSAFGDRKAARLLVADDGPGISPAVRARLFEPFTTTKGANGTGLGLWIVRQVVTRLGGRIDIEKGPLSGAAFVAIIPLAEALKEE